MDKKAYSGIMLALLLIGMLELAFNIHPVEANYTWTETIYILTDGSIKPATAPISTVDNVTYTLTDNIVGDIPEGESAIAVYRDDIVVDGSSHTVQGTGAENSWAIWLWNRNNVTIRNVEVADFSFGISLYYSTNITLRGNAASNNEYNFGVGGDDMSEFIHDIDTSNTVDGKPVYYLVDEADAIIDAQTNAGTVYLINCNNITVKDLTLTKNLHGISLVNTAGSTMENTTASANMYGLILDMTSDNNTISGNNISTNNYYGLALTGSSNNNIISGNNITDNPHDMLLHGSSSNNTVHGNHVAKSTYGLRLYACNNNTISGNTIAENTLYGVRLVSSSHNSFSGNNITANNGHGIWLHESSGNNISGNDIAYSTYGITLEHSSNNNSIAENNVTNNEWWGVNLYESSNNNGILRNNVADNEEDGISLDMSSSNNSIHGNNVASNMYAIRLWYSPNNSISENNIGSNEYGIYIRQSSENAFYHNNFINNLHQVYMYASMPGETPPINAWDDGYPSGGNYWSDFVDRYPDAKEIDGSGIWDTPYSIDENNQDNYPLLEPYSPLPRTIDELKSEIEELSSEGEIDNQGIVTSLLAKLDAAQKLIDEGKIDQAKNLLNAFLNEVQAQSGKHIAREAAELLIQAAEYILSNL